VRLSARTALPAEVRLPAYDPAAHGVGVVHLGIGAFHRAHQAVYFDDVLALDGGDWRICGVSLRSSHVAAQLNPQDGRYTLVERDGAAERLRVVGSVATVIPARSEREAAVAALARASTHLVTLTVTEKGYADPGTLGLLAEGLARRRRGGVAAPTLVSCDNLPDNGGVLHARLIAHAAADDEGLARWIEDEVACPSTMVDRIVPGTTPVDLGRVAARLGVEDLATVKTEPFTQWVVEDRFAGPRPALEQVGVQLVADVRPYELAKLRMLNGAHSTLAYLGLAAGYRFVHEAIADPGLRRVVERLMRQEAAATLPPMPGFDPAVHADALLARFANSALEHRLIQIAMDGTQKLPQRLLGTIGDLLDRNVDAPAARLGVAGWIVHAAGGEVDDPQADTLAAIARMCTNDARALTRRMLALLDCALAAHPAFVDALTRDVAALGSNPRARLAAA
jgi:fructuronate reductase